MALGTLYDFRFVDPKTFTCERPWVKIIPWVGAPGMPPGATSGLSEDVEAKADEVEYVRGAEVYEHPSYVDFLAGWFACHACEAGVAVHEANDTRTATRTMLVRVNLGSISGGGEDVNVSES